MKHYSAGRAPIATLTDIEATYLETLDFLNMPMRKPVCSYSHRITVPALFFVNAYMRALRKHVMPAHLIDFFQREQWAVLFSVVLISAAATYAALGLAEAIATASDISSAPLAIAAIELGLAIAATQCAILLSLLPSGAAMFSSKWLAISVFVSISGSWLGLLVASKWRGHVATAGAIVGLATAAAEYTNLHAVAASTGARHHPLLAILALFASILFNGAAFSISTVTTSRRARLASAMLITIGVCALSLFCSVELGLSHIIARYEATNYITEDWIAASVVPTALIILTLAIVSNYIGHFISALTQTQSRLAQALAEAEQANDARGRFLAHMSHELRTPLNAINGFSDLMKHEAFGQLNNRYREYAQIIHDSGSHLLNLVNQVLDVAKVDAGQLQLQDEDIDVSGAVSACAQLMTDQMARKKIIFSHDTASDMPTFRGDGRVFRQILLNLLSNAMKFTPEGGRVRLSAEVCERGLLVTVADTGLGIAPADVPRVFERFQQIDNPYTRSYRGTGLGLPLVKAFVEAQQGDIVINSALGEGTAVVITFPATRLYKADKPCRIAGPLRISDTSSGSLMTG